MSDIHDQEDEFTGEKSVRLPASDMTVSQRVVISEVINDPNKVLFDAGWKLVESAYNKNVFVSPDSQKRAVQTLDENGNILRTEYLHSDK